MKSEAILKQLGEAFEKMPDSERKELVKKTNGVFQMDIKDPDDGKTRTWTIDMKDKGTVSEGPAKKADVTIILPDATFADLTAGKENAQKLFMTGKLKLKGNVMFALKLDGVLKAVGPAAKL